MKNSIQVVILLFAIFASSGCLSTDRKQVSTSARASTGTFSGADSAVALSSTRIQVSWTASTSSSVKYYRIYSVNSSTRALTLAAQVSMSLTSYNSQNLTAGQEYLYVVRSVDSSGTEDSNLNIVGAVAYAGVTSSSSVSYTSAQLNFPSASGADSILVYCARRTEDEELMATLSNTATSASLTGLTPGSTYTCSVQTVGKTTDEEDGNTATVTFQTSSYSRLYYRGIRAVQAFGPASNAPSGTPSSAQVIITWNRFGSYYIGGSPSQTYALVRTGYGETLDTTTTTACTSSLTTSCLVCTASISGTEAQSCLDSNVALSPQKYDYAVVLMMDGEAEEIPSTGSSSYKITVPIPPANMVLVHRDAVNFEICTLLGKVYGTESSPSNGIDFLNHNRCAYTGFGDRPYNVGTDRSPLNLTSGYYDFGYNLFIDRWEAGCNWTPGACSGVTNAQASGDCYGAGAPSGGTSPDGTVFYRANTGNGTCWVKDSGVWTVASSGSLSQSQLANLYTNTPNPTYRKPPLTTISQDTAWLTCRQITDSTYGPKRLLRRREQIAAAAWPLLSGSVKATDVSATAYPSTTTEVNLVENESAHLTSGYYGCNTNSSGGIAAAAFNTSEHAGDATSTFHTLTIGSTASKGCVSRFGAQDMVGNVWETASDQLYICDSVGQTCTGQASTLDVGNLDFSSIHFNGVIGPGAMATQTWDLASGSAGVGALYFSIPLGIPLVTTDSGNALTIGTGITSAQFQSDDFFLYQNSSNTSRWWISGGAYASAAAAGRWTAQANWSTGANNIGFRCALPAE